MGSDFHWTADTIGHQQRVQAFLEARLKSGDRLVLAGDVFDIRVGRLGETSIESLEWEEWLQQILLRGVQVDWIEGNHDFHLQQLISRLQKFGTIARHPCGVTVPVSPGRTLRVEHGDLADSKDRGYRLMRWVLRSGLARAWSTRFWQLGAKQFARKLRQHSLGERQMKGAAPLNPVHIERIRKVFRSYAAELAQQGHDWVVLGHCHDADAFGFKLGERRIQYQNLGFPRYHRFILCLDNAVDGLVRMPID